LEREASYLNTILTTDTYAKEVRVFDFGAALKASFIKVRKLLFKEKFKIGKQKALSGFLAQGGEALAIAFTFGFIAYRTFQGMITVGDLVMYFQAFQKGQSAIQQALSSAVSLYNNRNFMTHLIHLRRKSAHYALQPFFYFWNLFYFPFFHFFWILLI